MVGPHPEAEDVNTGVLSPTCFKVAGMSLPSVTMSRSPQGGLVPMGVILLSLPRSTQQVGRAAFIPSSDLGGVLCCACRAKPSPYSALIHGANNVMRFPAGKGLTLLVRPKRL